MSESRVVICSRCGRLLHYEAFTGWIAPSASDSPCLHQPRPSDGIYALEYRDPSGGHDRPWRRLQILPWGGEVAATQRAAQWNAAQGWERYRVSMVVSFDDTSADRRWNWPVPRVE